MKPFRLRTLGQVELTGSPGALSLADPRHLALLVRLVASPDRGAAANDLLLSIWPHLTPQQGAAALQAAVEEVARVAGTPLVAAAADRWTLDRAVETDFDNATPSNATAFAAGLALADTPEWDEWVATVRAGIAARAAPPGMKVRPGRIIPVAILLLAVLVALLVLRRRPVEGFEPGDRVILADVEDLTTDSVGRAIQVAAAVALSQATKIELVSRARVVASLPSDRSAGESVIGRDLAFEAAARDAVPWVVTIRVEPGEAGARVTTRLYRTATGTVALEAGRSAGPTLQLIAATAETIRALLVRLGEPAATAGGQQQLGLVTTTSLDALRAYADGSASWAVGEYELARDYWHRALSLDTGFAMAMGSLGGASYYSHNRAEGERYYQEALARLGRLTEWEQLQLESRYAGWRGDLDSALALDRLIVARFPRASTYFSLGTALLRARRCAEGLVALEEARRLDPRFAAALINIATCHIHLDRPDQARLAYLEAGRLDTTALYRGNINLEFAGAALRSGHPEEAESALVRMTRRPLLVDQALGFRGLGFLEFWRGDVARAREAFRRAADLSRRQRAANSLLRNLALVAAMERAAGLDAERRQTLRQVDSLADLGDLAPGFLALAAELHIDDGHLARVRRLLDMARARADPRNRSDSLLVSYLAGAAELLAAAPGGGLAEFDRAQGYLYQQNLSLRRAQAYEQLGQLDSAHAVLNRILAAPVFGQESQMTWTRALIDVAVVEERLGRTSEAIASYRRFLEHWKRADPALPDVAMARGRLSALLARRDR